VPPHTVFLSLGSNLQDRERNLRRALVALGKAGVRLEQVSSIYETQPLDYLEQPWFLNCVLRGETELEPHALLRALQGIEARMGRKKTVPKGPRLIDIDILLYGDQTLDTPGLRVPHPRMLLRRFVLVPLAEIAPELRHPSWEATAGELLARTPDQSIVRPRFAAKV
jgi:2-amino-4-hydroxy-6-hydroxymethyldihydropteridine diphosphokinase